MSSEEPIERNLGAQPLDAIMTELALANHDLCATAEVQLTHKAVQRARKGRRLTPHMQKRIMETLNALMKARGLEQSYALKDLFTYGPAKAQS